MPKAIWKDVALAECDTTVEVEGNHYFPPDSLDRRYFTANDRRTVCPWKGTASYFDVTVDGETAEAAAWTYPHPSDAAAEIRDHVAFYPIVTVVTP